MLCDDKRELIETPCKHPLPGFLVSDDPETRKNHYSFVGFCPVSAVFRHVRSTQKEQYHQPQSGCGRLFLLLRRKEEDLVVHSIPRE